LLENGKKIRVVDILAPESARLAHPSIEYAKTSAVPTEAGFSSFCETLNDAETVYYIATCDVLTGTAADMYNVSVHGVVQALKACQTVGVPKMVHASSMAMTNQLLDHDNDDESTPLPSWDTYRCAYDISKREGEDLVVQATTPNFQPGILRLGTILAGTSDYVTREVLERPGKVIFARREPIDIISSSDICRAMLQANEKLGHSGNAISGQPMFVTRCKTNAPAGVHEVAELYAQELG
jgi:nucleoside-diphosphate-sugar epimerase